MLKLEKQYINKVKSALAQNGAAGQISSIKSKRDAKLLAEQMKKTLGINQFASMQMHQSSQERDLEKAITRVFNKNFNKLAMDAGRRDMVSHSKDLQNALTRSTQFRNALKVVENKLKKELRESTKVDSAKGIAENLSKVQAQLKSLKALEDRTKRQVARLNSTMKKMERDKKSEKYKIKGLDKSSDATKK